VRDTNKSSPRHIAIASPLCLARSLVLIVVKRDELSLITVAPIQVSSHGLWGGYVPGFNVKFSGVAALDANASLVWGLGQVVVHVPKIDIVFAGSKLMGLENVLKVVHVRRCGCEMRR
jgi:hypothetical protein